MTVVKPKLIRYGRNNNRHYKRKTTLSNKQVQQKSIKR